MPKYKHNIQIQTCDKTNIKHPNPKLESPNSNIKSNGPKPQVSIQKPQPKKQNAPHNKQQKQNAETQVGR